MSRLHPRAERRAKSVDLSTAPDCVVLDLRAAMGGGDAERFTAELARAYRRLADREGWQVTVLDGRDDATATHRLVLRFAGRGVRRLAREAGLHRVQRQPVNDRTGRRHTSGVTVAVLPDFVAPTISLDRSDIRIDRHRSSGNGGQNRNKRETAIRIVHLATGLVAESTDEREQHRNRELALATLGQRVRAAAHDELRVARGEVLTDHHGGGHIAERIRTYAFREGLAIDHRTGRSAPLERVLAGELGLLA